MKKRNISSIHHRRSPRSQAAFRPWSLENDIITLPETMNDDDIIEKLEDTFREAARHQLETLHAILQQNKGVSYLQRYLMIRDVDDDPLDAATFRRALPLSCYDDYADHINKLADGFLQDEKGRALLSVDQLICFFYSSGTASTKPKLIPSFDSKPGRAISSLAHQASGAILRRYFPPKSSSSKILGFLYAGKVTHTKGGYIAMAATSFPLYYKSPSTAQFLARFISPEEVIRGTDINQQMYCHLLCGLRHYDSVDSIGAPYAVGLIKALNLLETKWKNLSEDLENGIPCSEITDASMRQSVIDFLGGPQKDISRRVREICGDKSWECIIRKLWPNARYVKCVTTGSMAQYFPKIRYYAGELPVLGSDYFASECCVGINLNILEPPQLTRYVMLPTAAYFEFLPFDIGNCCVKVEEAVDFCGLEVGQMYELVVTTFRGLYRLRLGDIVKVVGFHHTSPEIEFVMRAPKSSGEMITEKDLISAIGRFQEKLRIEIVEFSSFLDSESEQKKLKVFIEVKDDSFLESVDEIRKSCSAVEDCLGGLYQVMKARGETGPLSLSIVKSGIFDALLEEAIRNGAPASQYKPPKIIRNKKIVEFLEMSTILNL